MATLVDHQIRTLSRTKGLIEPFFADQVNPASYDVKLGEEILVENDSGGFTSFDIKKDRFYMPPGCFVLACTQELIRVPIDTECIFQLKSSRGREGYGHQLAAYIDPGFHGRVTLELHNSRRFRELPLYYGLSIGQLRFARLNGIPNRPYSLTGRYNNAAGVEESKG